MILFKLTYLNTLTLHAERVTINTPCFIHVLAKRHVQYQHSNVKTITFFLLLC